MSIHSLVPIDIKTRRKLKIKIIHEYRCKSSQQTFRQAIPAASIMDYKVIFILPTQGSF
jgi:hypothetical protein